MTIFENRANDPVAFVRGTMIDSSPGATPPNGQDFVPYGHVSRAGSTPQSYSLWGSSEESNSDSIASHKRRFGKNLCQIITGFAAVLILMAVIGIVGIAVYLGYLSSEEEEMQNFTEKFVGSIRIERGDSWVQELTFEDTPPFKMKAKKYNNMLKRVFEKSDLGPSFQKVEVKEFSKGKNNNEFNVNFELELDRVKIPFWLLRDTPKEIEIILEQEVESASPIAFDSVKVDPNQIHVEKLSDSSPQTILSEEMNELSYTHGEPDRKDEFEVVPLNNSGGGILRVRPSEIEQNYNRRIEEILLEGKPISFERSTTTIPPSVTKSEIETQRTTEMKIKKETDKVSQGTESIISINTERITTTTSSPLPKIDKPTELIIKENLTDSHVVNKAVTTTLATHQSSTSIFDDVIKILLDNASQNSVKLEESSTKKTHHEITPPSEFFSRNATSSEATSTLRSLTFEQGPWKPINPNYVKPLDANVEHPSLDEEIEYVKFLPHEGMPLLKIYLSHPDSSSSHSLNVINETTSQSPLQTSSSSLHFDADMKLTSRIGAGITPSPQPIYISDSSELDNSDIILEGKSDISSYDSENNNEAVTEASPTIKDIQSILENLLYIATMKPSTLLNLSGEVSTENSNSPKDINYSTIDNIHRELSKFKDSQPEVELEKKDISDQLIPSMVQPSVFKQIKYPLDRFRYQAQKSSISTTTDSTIAVPFSPKVSLPLNIWNVLTTNKPLMLQTDVVTSTSFKINYGSTGSSLKPVYVHSSTNKNLLNLNLDKTFPGHNLVIPVISGKDVQYVKVNRTKENYPNVVIVNLADGENRGLENIGPLLVDSNGKRIEFTPDFIAGISGLLDKIKKQDQEDDNTSSHAETYRNIQGNPLRSELTELKNITFENALSYLNKFLLKQSMLQNFPTVSENTAKDKSSILPYEVKTPRINDKSNIVQDPVRPTKKAQRKSGKSLKISPTLTLYVIRRKDEKRPRVISIFDNSSELKHSDTSRNSPIHVFKFKEGQSLDDLLGEIFEAISKDKNEKGPNKKGKERDPLSSKEFDDTHSQTVPAGEDSLKVIEALSKLLTDHYDNYNLVFGNDNKPVSETKEPFFESTTVEIETSPFKGLVQTEYNEVHFTTPQIEISSIKHKKNETKSNYHKYHHELFPVMTRPLNPIRSTTPTNLMKFNLINNSNESVIPESSDPLDIVTSVDVSYSILHGNKSADCTENQFKCSNKKCIPLSSRCNLIRDCEDNSDERFCNCSEVLKGQHYTRKICDGIIDCWDRSDETNCAWCSPGQFICTGYQKCVKQELVCDGVPDCPNGDDERDCVSVAPNIIGANSIDYHDEGYLMVRKKGTWGKLCVENFEKTVAKADVAWTVNDLGDAVCKTLTFDSSSRVERILDSSPPIFRSVSVPYFELSIENDYTVAGRGENTNNEKNLHSSIKRSLPLEDGKTLDSESLKGSFLSLINEVELMQQKPGGGISKRDTHSHSNFERSLQFKETKCLNRDVVKIKCEELQCGVRPRAITQTARIVGGNNSSPGAWPWHAALYKEGEYQCGATLINNQWLLSAGHCFYSARNSYWVARLGALRRGAKFPSPFEQVRALSHIFIHPEYVNQGFINDISMLRLKDPVKLNDFVRPVCLPPPDAQIRDGQSCTLVGWGQLFEVKKVFPDTLQEVEVPLISTKECRKRTLFLPLYRLTEDMFCAGYVRGGRDACLGDSGGPLMCQKPEGKWEVMGVTSNGYGCARPHRPGVYTKVGNYLSWIEQVMELGEDERVIPEEARCEGRRCPLGECIPPSGVCNGKIECSNGIDEKNCPNQSPFDERRNAMKRRLR